MAGIAGFAMAVLACLFIGFVGKSGGHVAAGCLGFIVLIAVVFCAVMMISSGH